MNAKEEVSSAYECQGGGESECLSAKKEVRLSVKMLARR